MIKIESGNKFSTLIKGNNLFNKFTDLQSKTNPPKYQLLYKD